VQKALLRKSIAAQSWWRRNQARACGPDLLLLWWSCRESSPPQKPRWPAETLRWTTRNDVKVREMTAVTRKVLMASTSSKGGHLPASSKAAREVLLYESPCLGVVPKRGSE